jgi:aldose 1-epimerase
MLGWAAVAAVAVMAQADPAAAADAKRSVFGRMPDGREVPAVRLTNRNGVSANVIAYGAALQSMLVPDRAGRVADVTIGYADLASYIDKPQYFGSTVGRFANRIAKGRFTLDGRDYQVPVNNGANSLHGGTTGFDKVVWDVVSVRSGPTASVTLRYVSPDGDQGYPGTMTAEVTYSLDEANALTIEYRATTDKPTIVNLSNHAYWNLAGEGSATGAMGHVLTIPADTYLPTDAGAIPTGERASVRGTNFDFRTPHVIGDRVRDATDRQLVYGRGYDHNWIIGKAVTPGLHMMARVQEPVSGRGFELWSNQPGVQFYSGNFFDGSTSGKARKILRMGDAIVLEPQIFPDSINQRGFPEARLNPGQTYRNTIVYRFTGVGRATRG